MHLRMTLSRHHFSQNLKKNLEKNKSIIMLTANVAMTRNWNARKNPDGFAFFSNLRRKFVRIPDVSTRIGGQGKTSTISETRDPSRAMPVTMAQPRARVYMRTRGAPRKEGMDTDRKGEGISATSAPHA